MNDQLDFPSFDVRLSGLNRFILELVEEYSADKIKSWDDLEIRVKLFFTPKIMDEIESIAPGWKKMASYSEGITLTHVTCVFLGMFMLPEYLALPEYQMQLAKWIILFHDIDKSHIRGKKDTMHAFNSAVVAANTLPKLGFPTRDRFQDNIILWSEFTRQAFLQSGDGDSPKPDNQKLPKILGGIDQLFGKDAPAALITKTALLHISINIDKNYPTPSPLNEFEIKQLISPSVLPLLKVMMLSDTEGWSLFEPDVREQRMRDAMKAFKRVDELIFNTSHKGAN
ncbi:MAG TPA: hypothetical protein VJ987_11540 [Anaerolineales bacterium]|nr:hypothetical protein [Anaerolineales bacterium]